MVGRRGWGEDSIYFDHSGECRDPEAHRHCPGRWRGVVSLKPGPDGQRRRKKVSGKNKTEVRVKLAELHDELDDGVVTNAAYTVAQAIEDWLADGLAGQAPKTVSTQREVLEPLIDIIGAVPLRELSAPTVRSALKDLAATGATRTVGMTHAGLTRAIRHAEANDRVRRNVATLVETPAGQEGRPSKCSHSGQLTVRSIGNAYRSQARSSRDDFSAAVCARPSCPASRAAVHAGRGWLLACIAWSLLPCAHTWADRSVPPRWPAHRARASRSRRSPPYAGIYAYGGAG